MSRIMLHIMYCYIMLHIMLCYIMLHILLCYIMSLTHWRVNSTLILLEKYHIWLYFIINYIFFLQTNILLINIQ